MNIHNPIKLVVFYIYNAPQYDNSFKNEALELSD
mgnify:CR=1 FL=1